MLTGELKGNVSEGKLLALSLSLFFFHKRDFSGERGKGVQNKEANKGLGIVYARIPTPARKNQLSISSSPASPAGAAAEWGAGAWLSHGPGPGGDQPLATLPTGKKAPGSANWQPP